MQPTLVRLAKEVMTLIIKNYSSESQTMQITKSNAFEQNCNPLSWTDYFVSTPALRPATWFVCVW